MSYLPVGGISSIQNSVWYIVGVEQKQNKTLQKSDVSPSIHLHKMPDYTIARLKKRSCGLLAGSYGVCNPNPCSHMIVAWSHLIQIRSALNTDSCSSGWLRFPGQPQQIQAYPCTFWLQSTQKWENIGNMRHQPPHFPRKNFPPISLPELIFLST